MSGSKQREFMGGRLVKRAKGPVGLVSVVAVTSVLGANGALAQAAGDCITPPPGGPADTEICNLGTLTGGTYSRANGVNADGSVVVGYSDTPTGSRAFRWVEGGTTGDAEMENLGTLTGGGYSFAYGVNTDGSVVVGEAGSASGTRAFRWVAGGTQMANLGTLDAGNYSVATGVNADGSVVVGSSTSSLGSRAFRWVAGGVSGDSGNLQMENLGALNGGAYSDAFGVNADGNVVVGSSGSSLGTRAFRWVAGGISGDSGNLQMENLGTLDGGSSSGALDVNADGSVVVGTSDSSLGVRAFRWAEGGSSGDSENPQMENLGTLDGGFSSAARGVNADGSVVVGYSTSSLGVRAFRWVEGGTAGDAGNPEMENLGTLTGGTYSYAHGVSADGSIVVGFSNSTAGERAFIWRGAMQDFDNLIASFPVLANDSAVAAAQQQRALGQTMGQGFLAGDGQIAMRLHGGFGHTAQNPTTVGERSTALGRSVSATVSAMPLPWACPPALPAPTLPTTALTCSPPRALPLGAATAPGALPAPACRPVPRWAGAAPRARSPAAGCWPMSTSPPDRQRCKAGA
ncbi:hypothetical protein FVF75_01045 [Maritimibacter fusiformis]|uniref:Uncharacterized protein n=1 Tax=Maritimibacter fusiformis TaxID=2603819 RepID=A0A5D0RMV8_9RHOB|nr:hypothetical protein FVF75_01045 [Maritimibacter fusiformis]